MITPRLETAILNGWATYSKVSHALGMFGSIVVPDGSMFVIVDLKWFPFLDPIKIIQAGPGGENITTWRDLFRYNEYQLRIESKISTNYLQFRNEFDYKFFGEALSSEITAITEETNESESVYDEVGTIDGISTVDETGTFTGTQNIVTGAFSGTSTNQGTIVHNQDTTNHGTSSSNGSSLGSIVGNISGTAINLDDLIDYNLLKNHFLPLQKSPIQQDVYFVCEKFIKLTISRNCFISNINSPFAPLNSIANENPTPNGVQNVSVVLRADLTSPTPQTQYYFPPNIPNSGVDVANTRKTEGYKQDLDPTYSRLSNPDSALASINSDFPYQTTPLVEFGIVTINKQYFDQIMNS